MSANWLSGWLADCWFADMLQVLLADAAAATAPVAAGNAQAQNHILIEATYYIRYNFGSKIAPP